MSREIIKAVLREDDKLDLSMNGNYSEIMSTINTIIGNLAKETGMDIDDIYERLYTVQKAVIEILKDERV